MANRTGVLITVLVLVIVVLAGVVLFSLWVKPTFDGYVVDKQVDAQGFVFTALAQQSQQNNGIIQIPVGNQTWFFVRFNPQAQQPAQQAQAPVQ